MYIVFYVFYQLKEQRSVLSTTTYTLRSCNVISVLQGPDLCHVDCEYMFSLLPIPAVGITQHRNTRTLTVLYQHVYIHSKQIFTSLAFQACKHMVVCVHRGSMWQTCQFRAFHRSLIGRQESCSGPPTTIQQGPGGHFPLYYIHAGSSQALACVSGWCGVTQHSLIQKI